MSNEEAIFEGIYAAVENPDEIRGSSDLRTLLSRCPPDLDIQSQNVSGAGWPSQYNALTWAIDRQKVEALRVIVEHLRMTGKGIASGGIRNQNPIQLAMTNRKVKPIAGKPGGNVVFETLLRLSYPEELSAVVGDAGNRETAWHYAASENVIIVFETFEKYLQHALPKCRNFLDQTAFHIAAEKGHFEIVQYLSKVADNVVLLQDVNLETALHLAVKRGNYDTARFIVKNHPTSVAICNKNNQSPFLTRGGRLPPVKEKRIEPVLEYIKEMILRLQEFRGDHEETTMGEIRKLLYGKDSFTVPENDLFLNLSMFDHNEGFKEWLDGASNLAVDFESCLLEVRLPELRRMRKEQHQCIMSQTRSGTKLPANIVFDLLRRKGVKTVVQVDVRDCLTHPHGDSNIIQCFSDLVIRKLNWRKLDMGIEVLLHAVPHAEELTLYYSGNEEVLARWTGYEGLRRLKNLKKVHVVITKEEYSRRLDEYEKAGLTKEKLFQNIQDRFAEVKYHDHKVFLTYDPDTGKLAQSEPCPEGCAAKSLFDPVTVSLEEIPPEDPEDQADHDASTHSEQTFEEKMVRVLKSIRRLGQHTFRDRPDVKYLLKKRTKISILDSGADASQFRDLTGRSFIEDSGILDGQSASHWHTVTEPHGTQMAHLIRMMDPFSYLYIAKVDHDGVEINPAVQALKWATENGVDIVSISWTGPKFEGGGINPAETQLKAGFRQAVNDGVLLFCATGDQGENAKPSYPANFREAIPIASTTLLGDKLPTTESAAAAYLLPTEDIQTRAPAYLPNKKLPGSSAATAVAAGLASLILTCARFAYHDNQPHDLENDHAAVEAMVCRFKGEETMRKMFKELCSAGKNVQPEKLLSGIRGIDELQPDDLKAALKKELDRWLANAESKVLVTYV